MKDSSEHGDLLFFAIAMSLVLHGAIMFFAAPKVMSHTGSVDMEAKRTRHPPMSVQRFEGDPFRERVKEEPKSDAPAPREAPKVDQPGATAAPAAEIAAVEIPVAAPAVEMPEVISGPADAPVDLPKPSLPDAGAIRDR